MKNSLFLAANSGLTQEGKAGTFSTWRPSTAPRPSAALKMAARKGRRPARVRLRGPECGEIPGGGSGRWRR